ncbi:hypothetical protein [Nitrosopumilus sp.]|uniref:hypothetical protein n=1 Tax=Nitrosopumilus sp. TaxID=2024843 RepID=UPI0026034D7D|nr:hypothetical protein [Nitrosopumilus sp.]
MNKSLLIICCFTALTIMPIYADVSVQQIDNKTFVFNITSVTPIEIKEDNSELSAILEELTSTKDILSKGDMIIASATIFAFFTFGSFIVTKFQSSHIEEELGLMDIILGSTLTIQIIHLFAIWSIVSEIVEANYPNIILVTIIFLVVIFLAIRKLFRLENRDRDKSKSASQYFDSILEKAVKDNTTEEAYYNLRRKYNKDLRESGY